MIKLFTKGLIEDKIFEVTQIFGEYVYAYTTFKHNDNEKTVATIRVHINVWEKCVERFLFSVYYKKNSAD